MYNFNIENKSKKLIGSCIYFACLFVFLFISNEFSPILASTFNIVTTSNYNLARSILYKLFTIPLLCGFVIFLIDENSTFKTIFCCYRSKQKLLNSVYIFVFLHFPMLILLYINAITVHNVQIKIIISIVRLILNLQAEYLIILFARNKDEKLHLKLFFKNINYKKWIITDLVFFPLLIVPVLFGVIFGGGMIQSDNVIIYYISNIILYGFNIVLEPIYYILINNNAVKY